MLEFSLLLRNSPTPAEAESRWVNCLGTFLLWSTFLEPAYAQRQHSEKLLSGDTEFVHSAQGITGPSDQCEESLQQPQKHQKQTHTIGERCKASKADPSTPNAAHRLYWHPSSEGCSPVALCVTLLVLLRHLLIQQPSLGGWMLLHRRKRTSLLSLSPYLLYHNFALSPTCSTLFLLLVFTVTFTHYRDEGHRTDSNAHKTLFLSPNHWCSDPV